MNDVLLRYAYVHCIAWRNVYGWGRRGSCRERGDRGDESLMKLVQSNLDSDFVSEKESDLIGVF